MFKCEKLFVNVKFYLLIYRSAKQVIKGVTKMCWCCARNNLKPANDLYVCHAQMLQEIYVELANGDLVPGLIEEEGTEPMSHKKKVSFGEDRLPLIFKASFILAQSRRG